MKTKAAVLLAVALAATARLFATEYYVDAENGNDAYDGSSATRGEGDVGPKETLAGAMAISGLTSGDIVYAAEGYYTNKVMGTAPALYRVVVPRSVKLIASGRADRTFIVGKAADDDAEDRDSLGNGTGFLRCVYLNNGAQLIGFTVTGGHTPKSASDKDENAYGGGIVGASASGLSYVMDCIISNNMAGARGGAVYGISAAVRCVFSGNSCGSRIANSMLGSKAYNCLCKDAGNSYHFYSSTIYNCTFAGSGTSIRNGSAYNCICLVKDGGQNATFNNCYLVDLTASAITNNCVMTTAAKLALDGNYRPKPGSVAIDAGNPIHYNPPAAVDATLDFSGGARVIGNIDVGALEYDWRVLTPADGIEYSIATVEGGERLSVRRNFTSEKLVTGFTYGSDTVMFDDLAGGVWETTVPAATNFTLQPIIVTAQHDWYVNPDPTKGDDTNRGYHPDCPRRTLQGVMELAQSGDTVHAAPGRYEEGSYSNGVTQYRVVVPNGVTLAASGRADETFIMGASAPVGTVGRDTYGNGTNSVRCAYLGAGASLVGFTVTGGRTPNGGNGGALSSASANDSYVIDCIITNNMASNRGGAIYGGPTPIRCYFAGNHAVDTHIGQSFVSVQAYNCVFGATINSYHAYQSKLYSCTFLGPGTACRSCDVYNSLLRCDEWGKNNFYRCYYTENLHLSSGEENQVLDGTMKVTASQIAVDENYRPVAGSLAIDAGSAEYRTMPTALAASEKLDFAKGQRIYNGAVDIGAGEFDWRGVFGTKLRPGSARAQVLSASENVTTNVVDGIVLNDGDSVDVAYAVRTLASRICTFRAVVTGEGTVTARLGDEVLVPDAAGLYTYTPVVGDNFISLSFEGAGSVAVSDFAGPHIGSQFVIR